MSYEKLADFAIKNGADEAEIFIKLRQTKEARSEGFRIKNTSKISIETSVRIAVGKSVSTAYTTTDNIDKLKNVILKSINLAKNLPKDPKWTGLPVKKKPFKKVKNWSEELEDIDISVLSSKIEEDLNHIKNIDPRIKPASTYYRLESYRFTVINSNGLYAEDLFNGLVYVVELKAKDNSKEANTFGVKLSKSIDIDSINIIDETSHRALQLLNRENLDGRCKDPIALDPIATSSILFFSLVRAISGLAVDEGYSPLKNKLQQQIANKNLTVIDDGILEKGWNSRTFDDEGVPRRRTIIIEDGTLKGYIHNTYSAGIMDTESTGNALRRGGNVDVSITNLYLKPTNKDIDKLLSSYDKLILIKNMPMGVHTTNYITGSVNMVATEAYLIKKGTVEKILRPITVTGNIYESLKEIEIGGDLKETYFNVYTPTIVLKEFTVA